MTNRPHIKNLKPPVNLKTNWQYETYQKTWNLPDNEKLSWTRKITGKSETPNNLKPSLIPETHWQSEPPDNHVRLNPPKTLNLRKIWKPLQIFLSLLKPLRNWNLHTWNSLWNRKLWEPETHLTTCEVPKVAARNTGVHPSFILLTFTFPPH